MSRSSSRPDWLRQSLWGSIRQGNPIISRTSPGSRPGRMVPWSPLAPGQLARDWDEATGRSGRDPFADMLYTGKDSDHAIIDAVGEIAGARGVTRAQVALAGSASSRPSPPRSWA